MLRSFSRRWICIGLVIILDGIEGSQAWARVSGRPSAQALTQAHTRLDQLEKDPQRRRFRHHWMAVIAAYNAVIDRFSQSPEAPDAMQTVARLWSRLSHLSGRVSDVEQALVMYDRLHVQHPTSRWAADALLQRAQLYVKRLHQPLQAAQNIEVLLSRYPTSPEAQQGRLLRKGWPKALLSKPRVKTMAKPTDLRAVPSQTGSALTDKGRRSRPDKLTGPAETTPPVAHAPGIADAKLFGRRKKDDRGPLASVTAIKPWSHPISTRVAVYLSAPAQAQLGEIEEPADHSSPARIFIDIQGARLGPGIPSEMPIQDGVLQRVRVGRPREGTVRVVLDLKQAVQPRVRVMENPHRLVIDARVKQEGVGEAPALRSFKMSPHPRRVVLDPGHGGYDSGARGPDRWHEKDVVLAIGKKVQQLLEASGVQTLLTRSDDTFVPLEERTAMANRWGADAFVSIHANAASHDRARGIETYYLNVTDDRYAIRLAAVENKTSEQQVSDLQLILADLSTKANSQESIALAQRVQKRMVHYAKNLNTQTRDLGVKASLFYVLLGARMPSILVETSFISNADEARWLAHPLYQHALARAIAESITEHLKTPVHLVAPLSERLERS